MIHLIIKGQLEKHRNQSFMKFQNNSTLKKNAYKNDVNEDSEEIEMQNINSYSSHYNLNKSAAYKFEIKPRNLHSSMAMYNSVTKASNLTQRNNDNRAFTKKRRNVLILKSTSNKSYDPKSDKSKESKPPSNEITQSLNQSGCNSDLITNLNLEITSLKSSNQTLQKENSSLNHSISTLEASNTSLKSQIITLKSELLSVNADNKSQSDLITTLTTQNTSLLTIK